MSDNTSYSHKRERLSNAHFHLGILIFPITPPAEYWFQIQRGSKLAQDMAGATRRGLPHRYMSPKDLSTALESIRADLENLYLVSYKSNLTERAAVKIRCTRKGTKVITPHKKS